jgi:hypothetical protein
LFKATAAEILDTGYRILIVGSYSSGSDLASGGRDPCGELLASLFSLR